MAEGTLSPPACIWSSAQCFNTAMWRHHLQMFLVAFLATLGCLRPWLDTQEALIL